MFDAIGKGHIILHGEDRMQNKLVFRNGDGSEAIIPADLLPESQRDGRQMVDAVEAVKHLVQRVRELEEMSDRAIDEAGYLLGCMPTLDCRVCDYHDYCPEPMPGYEPDIETCRAAMRIFCDPKGAQISENADGLYSCAHCFHRSDELDLYHGYCTVIDGECFMMPDYKDAAEFEARLNKHLVEGEEIDKPCSHLPKPLACPYPKKLLEPGEDISPHCPFTKKWNTPCEWCDLKELRLLVEEEMEQLR